MDLTMFLRFLFFLIVLSTVECCDEMLEGDNGTFSSPGWPALYPMNAFCTYDIIVSEGNLVRLEFLNMSVEQSTNCVYDGVQIHDTNTSFILGNLCGTSKGTIYHSTTNFMTVKFKSDGVKNDYGFLAVYTAVSESEASCDKFLTGENGIFTSPNFPALYPISVVCQYLISVPEGYYVKLEFLEMSIEIEPSCNFDSVEIKDGNKSLGSFCGESKLAPFYSTSNELSVTFVSDQWVPKIGFLAEYTAVTEVGENNHTIINVAIAVDPPPLIIHAVCSEKQIYKGLSGIIESPNYPNNYPLSVSCSYGISVPEKMVIQITFDDFEVEFESGCKFDSVTLYESEEIHGVYCGILKPPVILSKSNSLNIIFVSDSYTTRRGFMLRYLTVPAPTTVLTTPTTTTTISAERTLLEDTSDDLMTIMLATFGVILTVSILGVVSGLLFCKYTKDNVKNLKKSKKKRRVIAVKELPSWSTKKIMPPLATQMNSTAKPLQNKCDLAMVDA